MLVLREYNPQYTLNDPKEPSVFFFIAQVTTQGLNNQRGGWKLAPQLEGAVKC